MSDTEDPSAGERPLDLISGTGSTEGLDLAVAVDAASPPRSDALDPLLVVPHRPAPLLIQSDQDFVTLELALDLYLAVARAGGTGWRASEVSRLRARIGSRFDASRRQHLRRETEHAIAWLSGLVDPEAEPGPLRFPVEPHAALVQDALDKQRDLVLEFIGPDEQTFHRVRVRPASLERGVSGEQVLGRRVPDGDELVVELERVRWLVVVERLGDLPEPRPLAEVKRFPFAVADPDD